MRGPISRLPSCNTAFVPRELQSSDALLFQPIATPATLPQSADVVPRSDFDVGSLRFAMITQSCLPELRRAPTSRRERQAAGVQPGRANDGAQNETWVGREGW